LRKDAEFKVLTGQAAISEIEAVGHRIEARVDVEEEAFMECGRLYFPGWAAWVDGQRIKTEIASGTGLIRFSVPEGSHNVVVQLKRTPCRLLAELLSLTAILCLGIACVFRVLRLRVRRC
jgi:hypothetical protein